MMAKLLLLLLLYLLLLVVVVVVRSEPEKGLVARTRICSCLTPHGVSIVPKNSGSTPRLLAGAEDETRT